MPLKKYIKGNKKPKPIWMTHRALSLVQMKRKVIAKYKDDDNPAVRKIATRATNEIKKPRGVLRGNLRKILNKIKNPSLHI